MNDFHKLNLSQRQIQELQDEKQKWIIGLYLSKNIKRTYQEFENKIKYNHQSYENISNKTNNLFFELLKNEYKDDHKEYQKQEIYYQNLFSQQKQIREQLLEHKFYALKEIYKQVIKIRNKEKILKFFKYIFVFLLFSITVIIGVVGATKVNNNFFFLIFLVPIGCYVLNELKEARMNNPYTKIIEHRKILVKYEKIAGKI